jgi:hypothetical protein
MTTSESKELISSDLLLRIKFFIHDLLNLRDDDRFYYEPDSPYASLYFSTLYFTFPEQELLYSFPTVHNKPLYVVVHDRIQYKASRSHVCSSHDLAPIFCSVFGLEHAFYKEPSFKKAYNKFEKQLKKKLNRGK